MYEGYRISKTDYYGYLGFTSGAIKYIKDPVIKQFAMYDLITREHPIVDKIKVEEAKISKVEAAISKQQKLMIAAKDSIRNLKACL